MRYALVILIGRCIRALARIRKPGGGSAIPGLIVNKLAPGYLTYALNSFPHGLVIVSGSSGKSTTTKMLVAIMRAHGLSVFTNPSTANIAQGLTSALLEHADLCGHISADIAVLEMDEAHGALIAPQLRPRVVVLTNVMTDQIDRFDDPEKVTAMLRVIAQRASECVVINADDALLNTISSTLAPQVVTQRYGVSDNVLNKTPNGLGYVRCETARLQPGTGTIIETVEDRSAQINSGGNRITVPLPARGVHFAVDTAAALAGGKAVLGEIFNVSTAITALHHLPPVFGRGEIVEVRGQKIEFVLVQNPASFQLNIDTLPQDRDSVFIAVGSDVRDPSYLWPVDVSRLKRIVCASGSQAYEIALQLEYYGVTVDRIEPNLSTALENFLAAPPPQRGIKTIIFSADAMRRIRSYLGLTHSANEDAL